MAKKRASPIVIKEELHLDNGGLGVIAQIQGFLKKHNIDDCSIENHLNHGYYDDVTVETELYYYGPKK